MDKTYSNLKLYDFPVERVKKVLQYYALISDHEILFLNSLGEKKFNFRDNRVFRSDIFSFKLSDVIGHPNGDIYIIGAEILKNRVFSILLYRIDMEGNNVWSEPIEKQIDNTFDTTDYNLRKNNFFSVHTNGYALACLDGSDVVVGINYQKENEPDWIYRLHKYSDTGILLQDKEFQSEINFDSRMYYLDQLPSNDIVVVRGNNRNLAISRHDRNTFALKGQSFLKLVLRFPIITNMITLNENEVMFTGYGDKNNNPKINQNFDVLCIDYNLTKDEMIDTILYGRIDHDEFSFYSYLDQLNNLHCIGSRRAKESQTYNDESSLYEFIFNLESREAYERNLLNSRGYEGFFCESGDESDNKFIYLGHTLDILRAEHTQSYYLTINQTSP